jgi:anaerobic C4-dicarboxylate transporter DcuB
MVAAIAIFGIAWMSDTYFQYAMPTFKAGITEMVTLYPWTFALAMFIVSVVVNSQAATCRMMLPVGLALGLPPALLIGIMPASYGYFFIPNYPSDIATVNFDVSGTTKIGKWYFNHSFMLPGLVGVISACLVGYGLASMVF